MRRSAELLAKARTLALLCATALLCAALLPPPGGARNQGHTPYKGKTAQKRPIQISVSQGSLTLIRFKVKLLCRDGSLLFADASDFEATPLSASGRFSDTQRGKSDVVSWTGRLAKGKIKGNLRVKDRLASGVRCDSQAVGFEAKRR
jgi:hypothetical protein